MKTFKLDVATTITSARLHILYFDDLITEFSVITTEDVEMLVNKKNSSDEWDVTSLADSDFNSQNDSASRTIETKTPLFLIPKNTTEKNFVFNHKVQNICFKAVSAIAKVYVTTK